VEIVQQKISNSYERLHQSRITKKTGKSDKGQGVPQLPPAQILQTELLGVSCGVLSQLPGREALEKRLRRER